jgi:hypothetical protein
MSDTAPGLEIIKLWSSVFLEKDLPDHEVPTQGLITLAEERSSDAVFAIEDPCVHWLQQQLTHAVSAYLHRTGCVSRPQWGARGQFVAYKRGAYRPLANEPGFHLAGMYVLRWPVQQGIAHGRDDGLPGYLSFYDPRVAMNMNAIKRDPYHGYHRSLRPRAGLLLLWPAYVSYFLHPNTSDDAALLVAFGVQLRAAEPGG